MNDRHGQEPNILPMVSVVVPVFNAEGWIAKTLSQFETQTYSNIEWVLVNDGSEDATSGLLRSWVPHCGHKIVIDKANGGGVICEERRSSKGAWRLHNVLGLR